MDAEPAAAPPSGDAVVAVTPADPAPAAESAAEGAAEAAPEHKVTVTRWDVFCLGPIVALTAWYYVMLPFAPGLLDRPIFLEAIRGSQPAMIAAGAQARIGGAPLWLAIIAPIGILCLADPFLYWAGRRYGRKVLDYLAGQDQRWERRIARMERFYRRWGAWTIAFGYFLPVPTALFYVAAGEARMRIRTFVLADAVGTLSWIGIHIGVGYAAGKPAADVATTISHYGLWFAVAIIVGAVAWTMVRYRPAQPAAAE